MERIINERYLKVVGSTPLPVDVDFGKDMELTIITSLVKEEIKEREDGTFDKYYHMKMVRYK